MCLFLRTRSEHIEKNRVSYGEDQESYLDGMIQEGFLKEEEEPVMRIAKEWAFQADGTASSRAPQRQKGLWRVWNICVVSVTRAWRTSTSFAAGTGRGSVALLFLVSFSLTLSPSSQMFCHLAVSPPVKDSERRERVLGDIQSLEHRTNTSSQLSVGRGGGAKRAEGPWAASRTNQLPRPAGPT